MSKLYLYSIFHGNLNYSSIPYESFHEIIDKCYWPLLDLIKEFNFKPSIEFPIRTLDKIGNIDPLFIKELKKTVLDKKCEIICSGQEQVVFPLVPEDINKTNLHKGKAEIQKRFEVKCETAFVNEQIFSTGLTPLYVEENFKNIILVRESIFNPSSSSKKENFVPAKIFYKNKNINVIWNSYFTYKQFQKYIDGKISKNNYLKYIYDHKQKNDSCFPMYGSDMEIFGYKNPVLGLRGDGKELHRFYQLLEELEKNSDLEFILTSKLIKKFQPIKKIDINSLRYLILEKKPDVKITRWATCGRDNSKSNSICYQLLKKLRILDGLYSNKNFLQTYLYDLIDCWASDYRTHTTETKHNNFHKITNLLNENLDKAIRKKIKQFSTRNKISDLVLVNPSNFDWNKLPFELQLHFQPSLFFDDICLYSNGKEIISQMEDTKFYKDKSIRSTTLVFEPQIKHKSCITVTLKSKISRIHNNLKKQNNICTSNVELILNRNDGSISKLTFSKIAKKPMINFFTKVSNSKLQLPFSGNVISVDRNGRYFTDLLNTEIFLEDGLNPIRSKLFCKFDLHFAHLTKIFYVYENHPRLDIKYIFNFKEFQPAIFRVGAITFNSNAFNKKSLCCSTNNGGKLESFTLEKQPIMHDQLVQSQLTNSSCLGSTECLIDFGDSEKGISIFSDKSTWYSVPMITYNAFSNNSNFSITHSVSDFDDTTMTWWKGRKEISFSMMGRNTNINRMEETSKMSFLGLLCISRNKNIKVN